MNDSGYYIAFLKSNTLLDKIIRWFSTKGSGIEEYSHVVFLHFGEEISLEFPRIKKSLFRERTYNEIYRIRDEDLGIQTWQLANEAKLKTERYGLWQVLFKMFMMLFGLRLIKARRDCAEFTLDCIYPETRGNNDFFTVGQVKNILIKNNDITFVKKITIQND